MKPLAARTAALAGSVLVALAALAPAPARAGNSSQIAAETSRTLQEGTSHVASFWWLPFEYWQEVARELKLPEEEQQKVAKFFPNYLIVGVIDADVSDIRKPKIAGIAEIVARTQFIREGEKVEVLREVSPEVADLVPKLVYLLRASMGKLGEGLRLLPLANISEKGDPIVTASKPGELEAEFRFVEGGPVHELHWHTPLTAVVGPKHCPKDGEPLEASWSYCPWHGVKLEDVAPAPAKKP